MMKRFDDVVVSAEMMLVCVLINAVFAVSAWMQHAVLLAVITTIVSIIALVVLIAGIKIGLFDK